VKEEVVYLGVDVAKAYLDAAIGSDKRRWLTMERAIGS
jgi:hypothetical protein